MDIFAAKTFYNAETRIWSGSTWQNNENYLGDAILKALKSNPEHINQISTDSDAHYTNQQMATLSIRAAQNLSKLGLQEGDVLALHAVNSDYVAPLYFGALLNGLPINAMDPNLDRDTIQHMCSTTKPKIMFCDGNDYDKVKCCLDECNLPAVIYTMTNARQDVPHVMQLFEETGAEQDFKLRQLKPETPALLLCSSGTTGLPKAVTISHARYLHHSWNLQSSDKWLCFSTPYWATGAMSIITGTIAGATRIISQKGFSPQNMLSIIVKYKVNILLTAPSHLALTVAYDKIQDYDLSCVKTYIATGGACAPHLVDKMESFMPNADFYTGYGMSELGTFCSLGPISSQRWTGQLVPNIEMMVINDDGQKLGPNEPGEVCVRSPQQWYGYYGQVAATQQVYNPLDRWYTSGDLGYFDSEGNLFIVDRKKDILKYNNYAFSPSEIESVIMELPQVAEVCVFGVPDVVSSSLPAAMIVKVNGADLTEKEIVDHMASRVGDYKRLRGGIFFAEKLPKTASGKPLRSKVMEMCCGKDSSKLA